MYMYDNAYTKQLPWPLQEDRTHLAKEHLSLLDPTNHIRRQYISQDSPLHWIFDILELIDLNKVKFLLFSGTWLSSTH